MAMKPAAVVMGSSGIDSATATASGAVAASARQAWVARRGTSASVKARGRTNTITAPAVIPSIASAITKNAR
jgi:uncharacterized protein YgiB involved in biofilm formation